MAVDVTRANFGSAFPRVERALQECAFFSIDCEMTGERALDLSRDLRRGVKRTHRGTRAELAWGACTHDLHGAWRAQPLSPPRFCMHAGLFVDASQENYLDDMEDRWVRTR